MPVLSIRWVNQFQFTHPGGVRLEEVFEKDPSYVVSIHAPGRGATIIGHELFGDIKFQFTHPGGVRREEGEGELRLLKFQFTHPGGVRRSSHLGK